MVGPAQGPPVLDVQPGIAFRGSVQVVNAA